MIPSAEGRDEKCGSVEFLALKGKWQSPITEVYVLDRPVY